MRPDYETLYKQLKHDMQTIAIAQVVTYAKHMTDEQLRAAAEDWNRLVTANGWQELFCASPILPAAQRW